MIRGTDILLNALKNAGKTQTELATYMGMSKQCLSSRLKNDSLSVEETDNALRFCGYSLKVVDEEEREPLKMGNTKNPRVSKMVNGKLRDTDKAESLLTIEIAPNMCLFAELFVDADGEHFMVYQGSGLTQSSVVADISCKAANEIIDRYGKR